MSLADGGLPAKSASMGNPPPGEMHNFSKNKEPGIIQCTEGAPKWEVSASWWVLHKYRPKTVINSIKVYAEKQLYVNNKKRLTLVASQVTGKIVGGKNVQRHFWESSTVSLAVVLNILHDFHLPHECGETSFELFLIFSSGEHDKLLWGFNIKNSIFVPFFACLCLPKEKEIRHTNLNIPSYWIFYLFYLCWLWMWKNLGYLERKEAPFSICENIKKRFTEFKYTKNVSCTCKTVFENLKSICIFSNICIISNKFCTFL